jgi:hypothetical protein
MSTIVTREGKGSELTHAEVDSNFTNLNADKAETSSLSSVATSGSYNDLYNKPAIPTTLTDLGITDGSNGQFLSTDGAGNFSFSDAGGGGGGEYVLFGTYTSISALNSALSYNGNIGNYKKIKIDIKMVRTTYSTTPIGIMYLQAINSSNTAIYGSSSMKFFYSTGLSYANYLNYTALYIDPPVSSNYNHRHGYIELNAVGSTFNSASAVVTRSEMHGNYYSSTISTSQAYYANIAFCHCHIPGSVSGFTFNAADLDFNEFDVWVRT